MIGRPASLVAPALAAIGLAFATPALAQPANPFQLEAPDPFKQEALPLPPRPAPADRGSEPAAVEAPSKGPAANLTPQTMPTEDQVYATYQRGFFVEAFALATERAEAGDAQAMTLLGHLYELGQGIPGDTVKAALWYGLAAKRGDREGQVALALLYLSGEGVSRDKRRAMELFETAARQDQPIALFNLAQLYNEGEIVTPDPGKALTLMRRAAELGNTEAAYGYALMLDDADEPGKDAEVTHWLGVAALNGHVPAEIEYAIRLANGRGIEKNLERAAFYMSRAAWAGNPVAQNRLAYLYLTGSGVHYDPIDAAKWHLIAKASGHPDLELDGFLATLKPDELAEAQKRVAHWPNEPADPAPANFAPKPANVAPTGLHGPLDEARPAPTASVARTPADPPSEPVPPLASPPAVPSAAP
ncbi:MAG: HcpA family protein [Ancalomicrobiaceae bacterium]|nr:HcpA family protein [Ancalomicrobiaceae bacterium]